MIHRFRQGKKLPASYYLSSFPNNGILTARRRRALTAWTTSNITAGSDTTAMLLRTIFYNLLQHPSDLHRLLSELDEADRQNPLSSLVTWKETRGLEFLDACIKEAGRIHPPFGLPLERVVPPGGATICGQQFEGGTVVGMSGWVIHRNQATFGEDSDVWRPQRWLEGDEAARKKMESRLLTVRGAPSCPLFLKVSPRHARKIHKSRRMLT